MQVSYIHVHMHIIPAKLMLGEKKKASKIAFCKTNAGKKKH